MQPGFSAITTSKYYHPAFNSAIFDGPIRIYFVQFHETYALKIYFMLQDRFKDRISHYKDMAKQNSQTLLIMIYPTEDSFQRAFAHEEGVANMTFAKVDTPRDSVFGLLAPVVDVNVGRLMDELSDIFRKWERAALAQVITPVTVNSMPLSESI